MVWFCCRILNTLNAKFSGYFSMEAYQCFFDLHDCTFKQIFNLFFPKYKQWLSFQVEMLGVVTIAMICSTSASLWKFQYIRRPICNLVKHLWWSFYCKNSKSLRAIPVNITKGLSHRSSIFLQIFTITLYLWMEQILKISASKLFPLNFYWFLKILKFPWILSISWEK